MAFKLNKNGGANRAPDLVEDIPAGSAFATTPSTIVSGKAVTITSGALVTSATGDDVAGILAVNYPDVDYGGGINSTFPDGVTAGETNLLFMPVTAINPIEADIEVAETAAGDIVVGETLNIHTTGTGLDGTTSATGVDFRVVKITARDADGRATKVEGFFLSRGYFA